MDEDDFVDFDPYDWIVQMSQVMDALTLNHNQLVDDYAKTKKRLAMVERQLIEIQMQLLAKDSI